MILIILIILINTNLSNISIKVLLIGIRKIWFLEEFDIEYYIFYCVLIFNTILKHKTFLINNEKT